MILENTDTTVIFDKNGNLTWDGIFLGTFDSQEIARVTASDDSIEISFANGVSIGVDVGADRNFYMRVKRGDIQILKNLRVKYKEIPQKIKEFLAGKVKPMTIISGDNVYIDGNKLWWNCTKVAECPKVVYGEIEERGEALFFSVGDKRVKLREISMKHQGLVINGDVVYYDGYYLGKFDKFVSATEENRIITVVFCGGDSVVQFDYNSA